MPNKHKTLIEGYFLNAIMYKLIFFCLNAYIVWLENIKFSDEKSLYCFFHI